MRSLVLLFLALAALAAAAFAAPGDSRTLVLRGRVLATDGRPVAGARVTSRGSHVGSALTDDLGRWSLNVALGTAAALAREPFALELRAEDGGRRVPFEGGAAAFVLEVSLVQRAGEAIVRVRSNQAAAAAGVVTAFATDGAVNAWVSADFGGAPRAGGDARVTEEAAIPGFAPPAGTPDAGPAPVAPAAAPASRASDTPMPRAGDAPAAARSPDTSALPPGGTPPEPRAPVAPESPAIARRASADSVARARAEKLRADSLAWAESRALRAAERAAAKAAARARLDSVATARREQRRADSLAWVERRARGRAISPRPEAAADLRVAQPSSAPPATPVSAPPTEAPPIATPSAATSAAPDTSVAHTRVVVRDDDAPARAQSSVLGERVRRIESFAPRIERAEPDSCACRLRGTVEVAWPGRPSESRLPVTITLDGPATQTRRVELFMGPPREFWFGPIPCGDYRVTVRATGRQRYGLVTGDRPLIVRCEGPGEIRLVLEPLRR